RRNSTWQRRHPPRKRWDPPRQGWHSSRSRRHQTGPRRQRRSSRPTDQDVSRTQRKNLKGARSCLRTRCVRKQDLAPNLFLFEIIQPPFAVEGLSRRSINPKVHKPSSPVQSLYPVVLAPVRSLRAEVQLNIAVFIRRRVFQFEERT